MDYLAKIREIKEEKLKNILEEEKKGTCAHLQGEKSELSEISPLADCDLSVEPAGTISPVFWEQSHGRIVGPGTVSHVAKVGDSEFWLCVDYAGSWLWINADILRSRDSFERQGQRVCNCCNGSEFWESIHGATICGHCHPPAHPSLIRA